GWILQKLLALAIIKFYSANSKYLGSKILLEQEIYKIIKIPIKALKKYRLEEFSINNYISWAYKYKTTVKEDKAYYLLGIFSVFLLLIYNKGESYIMQYLIKKIKA
ncbi:hypothetical protein EV356DRAFT_457761, partial [Viridothelium virens]